MVVFNIMVRMKQNLIEYTIKLTFITCATLVWSTWTLKCTHEVDTINKKWF
jgi:hypothetical protein